MLKVSRVDNGDSTTLKLEGKLLGAWVEDFTRLLIEFPKASLLNLDLAAVNFVDFAGAELLKDLINGGATVVTCSSFIAELLAGEGAMTQTNLGPAVPSNCAAACGNEREFISRLQAGDAVAYETLVREFGPRMHATARRFLPCSQDSDDAVQDAFISAFQSIRSFQEHSTLATWLHRITVNACLMALRSRGRRKLASVDGLLPQFHESGHHAARISRWDDTVAQVATQEQRLLVRSCIDRVPEPYRAVLLLRDIEQLDTEQTAELLGTSTGNIKTRLHRARQVLRSLMQSVLDSSDVAS